MFSRRSICVSLGVIVAGYVALDTGVPLNADDSNRLLSSRVPETDKCPEPIEDPCPHIEHLEVTCNPDRGGLRATVFTDLPAATWLRLTADGKFYGHAVVNWWGRATTLWRNPVIGEHEVCIDGCDICATVICPCVTDADCDDALFCNGEETCDTTSGQCVEGENPCEAEETCDEVADACATLQVPKIFFTPIDLSTNTRDIWMADPDGSNPVQLTFDGTSINPRVSPDGTQIVFCSAGDGNPRPWLMAADGTEAHPLSPDLTDMAMGDCGFMEFAWSSDGERIAIAELIHPNTQLWIVGTDGSLLAENLLGGRGGFPDWIPGTESLLINNETTPNQSQTMELWRIEIGQDANGDGEWDGTQLTFDGNSDDTVNLSPDGTRIGWARASSGWSDLHVVVADFDGYSLANMTQCTARYSERPVWSPDGSTLVYTGRYPDADLCVVDVNADNTCANERTLLHWPGFYLYMGDYAMVNAQ